LKFFSPPTINEKMTKSRKSCLDPGKGTPVILLTRGRSGSSSTWQMIGNLTGKETPDEEYPGSGNDILKFYEGLDKEKSRQRGGWVIEKLCEKQKVQKVLSDDVFGFKYKPYHHVHPQFMAAFESIANIKSPLIKIVRLRRNLLDVYLSGFKHKTKTPAHCKKGKKMIECLKLHLQAGTGMKLSPQSVLNFLRKTTKDEDEVDQMLQNLGIRHVIVSFENLYYNGQKTTEWLKIINFLNDGSEHSLPKHKVDSAMRSIATNNPLHNVTIKNYEEIKKTLEGTEFQHLLH